MSASTKATTTTSAASSTPPLHPVTKQVLDCLDAENPRTQEILSHLISSLHDFVQNVRPTTKEWFQAIEFLTRTGQKCDEKRQEFILLSDVLGISMLVDSLQNTQDVPGATPSTVQGPFHAPSDPADMGDQIAHGLEQERGEAVWVQGIIQDASTGQPIGEATLDVWQSDDLGYYDLQTHQDKKNLRATFTTASDGRYWFQTIRPASYPVPTDGPVGELLKAMGRHAMRPAHIHFLVQAPGYRRLVTHLFVQGDPYLESDAVFGVKDALIVEFVKNNETGGYMVDFTIGLVPDDETRTT